jgi:hypothetical protein
MMYALQQVFDPIVGILAEKAALMVGVLIIGLWLLQMERNRNG